MFGFDGRVADSMTCRYVGGAWRDLDWISFSEARLLTAALLRTYVPVLDKLADCDTLSFTLLLSLHLLCWDSGVGICMSGSRLVDYEARDGGVKGCFSTFLLFFFFFRI